jgi:hypothetical protein
MTELDGAMWVANDVIVEPSVGFALGVMDGFVVKGGFLPFASVAGAKALNKA